MVELTREWECNTWLLSLCKY